MKNILWVDNVHRKNIDDQISCKAENSNLTKPVFFNVSVNLHGTYWICYTFVLRKGVLHDVNEKPVGQFHAVLMQPSLEFIEASVRTFAMCVRYHCQEF